MNQNVLVFVKQTQSGYDHALGEAGEGECEIVSFMYFMTLFNLKK